MCTFHSRSRQAPQLVRDGGFSQAMQMANVDGEAEEGMIDPPPQLGVAVHHVDEHAGFRLERQPNLPGLRVAAQLETAIGQAVEKFVRRRGCGRWRHPARHGPRPEAQRVAAEFGSHVHRSFEEVEPPLAFGRWAEQRRLVLAARVEQEAGAGFDDRMQAVLLQQRLHRGQLARQVWIERVEAW